MPAIDVAELRSKYAPRGEGGLLLDSKESHCHDNALDDWQGVRGRFRYSFWTIEAIALTQVVCHISTKPYSIRPAPQFSFSAETKRSHILDGRPCGACRDTTAKARFAKNARCSAKPGGNRSDRPVIIYRGTKKSKTLRNADPSHHLALPPVATLRQW